MVVSHHRMPWLGINLGWQGKRNAKQRTDKRNPRLLVLRAAGSGVDTKELVYPRCQLSACTRITQVVERPGVLRVNDQGVLEVLSSAATMQIFLCVVCVQNQ